ncbi:carboxylic ester hydrolase [Elysia marginata]|uniref:Carboxylic ester hydrolase n=1 Tax=Elysia marginata TaxID=1093978 RepID=A0AAV4HBP5_9GAST|nr:carboxylic ester hydrolase [Elysia marginata]
MANLLSSKLVRIGAFVTLIALVVISAVVLVILKPWEKHHDARNEKPDVQSYIQVPTTHGDVKGLTYRVSDVENIDVFYGIPFAQPPVGELRLARPERVGTWSPAVKDATKFGNICLQQNPMYSSMTNMSEDCLYVNIFSPRNTVGANDKPLPVMMYVHPGSFRDGSAPYFNYTNLALKGVVVVTTNYRLDGLGFLSTQDDVIPGNFGLLDVALALEFVKEIISSFRGDPKDVTMFGASAGSAIVTEMALSPLTRGKFQRAIMQSGPGTSYWASYIPGFPNPPREVAFALGKRLNCQISEKETERDQSQALLKCLRGQTPENLMANITELTKKDYNSEIIFVPVSGDAFGFLPELPSELASNYTTMVPIPTIRGWSSNDSSWTIDDPFDKGVSYDAVATYLRAVIYALYPGDFPTMFKTALDIYNLTDSSVLSPYDVRSIYIQLRTDLFMESFIVKEARQFSKAASELAVTPDKKAKTFVYQYDYRPSYQTGPAWQGVTHMDEMGMVMGLPNGPKPLTYPVTNEEDHAVGELMTTMWSNFAKYGDPTPKPLDNGVKWPKFGHTYGNQSLLVIRPKPVVREYDRDEPVVLWTGDSGLDG